jgi:hypothetical protein
LFQIAVWKKRTAFCFNFQFKNVRRFVSNHSLIKRTAFCFKSQFNKTYSFLLQFSVLKRTPYCFKSPLMAPKVSLKTRGSPGSVV